MPIDLTSLSKATQSNATNITPKYFHSEITGNGGKVGLLNNTNSKVEDIDKNMTQLISVGMFDSLINSELTIMSNADSLELFKNYLANQKENTTVDVTRIKTGLFSEIVKLNKTTNQKFVGFDSDCEPNVLKDLEYTLIGENDQYEVNIAVATSEIARMKKTLSNSKVKKAYNFNLYFVIQLIAKNKANTTSKTTINYNVLSNSYQDGEYILINKVGNDSSMNKIKHLVDLIESKSQGALINPVTNAKLTTQELEEFVNNIDISANLTKQAVCATDKTLEDVANLLKIQIQNRKSNSSDQILHDLKRQLSNMYPLIEKNDNNYTEKEYQDLYNNLKDYMLTQKSPATNQPLLSSFEFEQLIGSNVRLSLTHLLSDLDQNTNVFKFQPTKKLNNPNYSTEQQAIIETTEPYTIGVAGAGSGKSHTLIGRLNYLKDNGIDMDSVLVTSFSNAAANTITDRIGDEINSLTNANMFNKIYSESFSHNLANNLTFKNTLDVVKDSKKLLASSPTMKKTIDELTHVFRNEGKFFKSNVSDSKTQSESLSLIVNNSFDDVITLLDVTNQTTLSIQPIIVNAMIQMNKPVKFPKELTGINFIISDESQDTSAFEYVLLLRLAKLNNAQLMIIGDANQTLYEFRNANPRFLTTLERSPVFTTYKLKTNYRSHQDILTYVNPILEVLETNATAKIQLNSNIYSNFDAKRFKENVQYLDVPVYKKKDDYTLDETLITYPKFVDWVQEQYQNKKQIAILSHTHRDVNLIANAVTEIISSKFGHEPSIYNTRDGRRNANTLLSTLITKAKHNIKKVMADKSTCSLKSLQEVLEVELKIINKRNKYPVAQSLLNAISDIIHSPVNKKRIVELRNNSLSIDKFYASLANEFIQKENTMNATKALLAQDNVPKDLSKFDVIVSTIHSTKGMEFDSTICFLNTTQMVRRGSIQESLRLLGVALTRAKESEFVINGFEEKDYKIGDNILDEHQDPTDEFKALTPSEVHNALLKNPLEVAYAQTLNQ